MKLDTRPVQAAAAAAAPVDVFDRLPDDVVVRVLDLVSDVRALARCSCLNRRFAALVPHAEHLHVEVDAVVSPSSSSSAPFFFSSSHTGSGLLFLIVPLLHRVLFSLLNSISALLYDDHKPQGGARVVYGTPPPGDDGRHGQKGASAESPSSSSSSPCAAALLRGFHRVRTVRIELPAGDRPRISSKGAAANVLRWRAVFGCRLRTCVILAARSYGPMLDEGVYTRADDHHHGEEEEEEEAAMGLKERVIWTIGALIAASARHHMARDVVLGDKGEGMDELVVADRDREGLVMMGREGLREWRKEEERRHEQEESSSSIFLSDSDDPTVAERKGRTTVPAVRMTMRHVGRVDLGGGMEMRGAVLVVVRAVGGAVPAADQSGAAAAPELDDDKALVEAAFKEDQVSMTAAQHMLKRPSYLLEMNSF